MKILILFAFEDELKHFANSLSYFEKSHSAKREYLTTSINGHHLYVALSGIGTTNAANTTTALCEALNPECIFICGSAGGLIAGQKTGDILLGEKIIDIDLFNLPEILRGTPYESCLTDPHSKQAFAREFFPHPELLAICADTELSQIYRGIIATSNFFPAPKESFEQIKKLGCAGIEMESSAVFNAAKHYRIPVMTVRAISNSLDAEGNDLGTADDALNICSQRLSDYLWDLLNRIGTLKLGAEH